MTPENVLAPAEYENYRKVRALAMWFIAFGSMFLIVGIAWLTGHESVVDKPARAAAVGIAGLVLGPAGVVGGIAVRLRNERWGKLVKVVAWVWVWAFPIGTVLSLSILDRLPKYFKSAQRLRQAEAEAADVADEGNPEATE